MTKNPCAKINIGLNIVSRRADGYHNLETVFYPIPLYDRLTIEEAPVGGAMCRLETTGQAVDCAPEDNLVVRAYHLLSEHYPLPPVTIRLHKGIPSQAGLGGGSSDVGFAIRMLNEQFALGMSPDEMLRFLHRPRALLRHRYRRRASPLRRRDDPTVRLLAGDCEAPRGRIDQGSLLAGACQGSEGELPGDSE